MVKCRARRQGEQTTLDVSASHKRYLAKFNHAGRPARVMLDGTPVPQAGALDELQRMPLGWFFDPSSTLYVKFTALGQRSLLAIGN